MFNLRDIIYQLRRQMQISGGGAFGVDVVKHHLDLLRGEAKAFGNCFCPALHYFWHTGTDPSCRRAVKNRTRPGPGPWNMCPWWGDVCDLFRYTQIFGQLVDLGFVEMGNGFDIGGTVAELYEKALVVFQAVGCAGDRIVQAVGMIVLQHLAGALFEIGGGHNLEIGFQRQALFDDLSIRAFGHDGKKIEAFFLHDIGSDDLGLPAVTVFGYDLRTASS